MIEQIDRDAATELATIIFGNGHSLVAELRTAERHFMLDAFARHRAAGMERAAEIAEESMILLSLGKPEDGPFTRQDKAVDEARASIAAAIRAEKDKS